MNHSIRFLGMTVALIAFAPLLQAAPATEPQGIPDKQTVTPATTQPPPPTRQQLVTQQMEGFAAKGDQANFDRLRKSLEEEGSPEALTALGDLYRDLSTVYHLRVRKPEIAARYYQRSIAVAEQNKTESTASNTARVSLARLILAQHLKNHDFGYAIDLLKKAIENGNNDAAYMYARRLERGYAATPPDYKGAEYWYRYAVRGGVGEAALSLASIYHRQLVKPPTPTSESDMLKLGLTQLRQRAANSDGAAAFVIGRLYAMGTGVEADPKAALEWYERGIKLGSIAAMRQMALLTSRAGDRKQAAAYMEKAAEAGSVSAAGEMGRSLILPGDYYLDVPADKAEIWLYRSANIGEPPSVLLYSNRLILAGKSQEAVEFLERMAGEGVLDAYADLYRLFKTGYGVVKDDKRARRYIITALQSPDMTAAQQAKFASLMLDPVEPVFDAKAGYAWMLDAANSGSSDAMAALADLYMKGNVLPKNPPLSLSWRKKASVAGDIGSTLELSRLYREGIYVPLDQKRSSRLLTGVLRNVAADDAKGMLAIGRAFIEGRVVARNAEEAAKWFHRAADGGETEALVSLGRLVKWGSLMDYRPEQSLTLFRQAASSGSHSAMMELGMLSANGMLLPQDNKAAFQSFMMAADNGSTEGMRQVGLAYISGIGMEKDKAKARTYIERAAGFGNGFAMVDLGNILDAEGNRGAAWTWWKRAAELNIPDALYMMAVASRTGEAGVPRDPAAMQRYLVQAAALSNYPAKRELRLQAAAKAAAEAPPPAPAPAVPAAAASVAAKPTLYPPPIAPAH